MNKKPIQKIIFGSPGTGKSFRIDNEIIPKELKITDKSNIIKTVFHPEYTYGDFMGKLMPLTDDSGKVSYHFFPGHFLIAIGRAYKNIITSYLDKNAEEETILAEYKKEINKTNQSTFSSEEKSELLRRQSEIQIKNPKNVVLVIDEINRGNSASIFGTVFQLLDRTKNGWSDYHITLSELEIIRLKKEIGFSYFEEREGGKTKEKSKFDGKEISISKVDEYLDLIFNELNEDSKIKIQDSQIKLPPNLSIIATMNTSDNSIYFMDNAFKRRWDWEFINVDDDNQGDVIKHRKIEINGKKYNWEEFVNNLNNFIRSKYKEIRKIEDKQIGYFFVNEEIITEEHIKNKLLFFIWDSVFTNNKKPLVKLLDLSDDNLVTFGQFAMQANNFVEKIMQFE